MLPLLAIITILVSSVFAAFIADSTSRTDRPIQHYFSEWAYCSAGIWLAISVYIVICFSLDVFLSTEWRRALVVAAFLAAAWVGFYARFPLTLTLSERAKAPAGVDQIDRANAYCKGNSELQVKLNGFLQTSPNRGQMVKFLDQVRNESSNAAR
jgi:hypothetical protein